jgi:hypothetical protein
VVGMEPAIFFLFFLLGIVPMLVGYFKRIPAFAMIGGLLIAFLWAPMSIEGFTQTLMYQKNITTSYNYYPLYGNGTINMTLNSSNSQTYGYTTMTTKNDFTLYLAVICAGVGLAGVIGSIYLWKNPDS